MKFLTLKNIKLLMLLAAVGLIQTATNAVTIKSRM